VSQFDPSWAEGPNILPAMLLAEEQINNMTDLLPYHKLELIVVDGGCDIAATTAVNTTIGLFNGTGVIGMIGPGCSASSIQAAHVMNQPEIELVQLHGGGSNLLENRTLFSNSIGILGSTQAFVNLSLELINKSGWQNIAILYEDNRVYYRSTKELFVKEVKQMNVRVLFESTIYRSFYPLDGIRSSLARIVFVFTAPSHSMKIMCLAYRMRMFHPAYQWVIMSRRREDFCNTPTCTLDNETYSFRYHNEDYNCSLRDILHDSLNKAFLMSYQVTTTDTHEAKPKLGNISFNKFLELYSQSTDITQTYWAYYFYDAVWAWAHVLHRLIDKDSEFFNNYQRECFPRSCFQYGNKTMANLILEEFYASDFAFEGMSGPISFDSRTGYNDRPVHLYQIVDGEEMYVPLNSSMLDTISDTFRLVGLVDPLLIALFAVLLFLLFFIILFLHVLTVLYRDSKFVKASSPNLTHFAFTGAYLLNFGCLLFIFLNVKEHSGDVSGPICHAVWAWFFPIGFTLVIGTVMVRSWRLYRIFVHYLDPGKFISNPALITMLVAMVTVDITIAVIWTAVDPRMLMMVDREVDIGPARGLLIHRTCRSQKQESAWLVVVLSYKVAELTALVSLTLLTRHIPNKTFTNSPLRVFSYSFSAVFGIGFALYYFFLYFLRNTHANVKYTILYFTLIILMVLYILLVFIPPLMPVIRTKIGARKWKISEISRARKTTSSKDQLSIRKTSKEALL
jgi:ABC-type branched-subunit amino acid transport system substrate-binding protein